MKKMKCVNVKGDEKLTDYVLNLIFNEWVPDPLARLKKKEKALRDDSKKCYAVLFGEKPVGCFVLCDNDIPDFPQYNPNLACVCVDKDYRGRNFGLFILEESKAELKRLGYKEAYLKTDLKNFYERVGWYVIGEIGSEKIYKIDL